MTIRFNTHAKDTDRSEYGGTRIVEVKYTGNQVTSEIQRRPYNGTVFKQTFDCTQTAERLIKY